MSEAATPDARGLARVARKVARRWAAGPVLAVALAALTTGAFYTSILVSLQQNAPSEASRYNVTWVVGQTGV